MSTPPEGGVEASVMLEAWRLRIRALVDRWARALPDPPPSPVSPDWSISEQPGHCTWALVCELEADLIIELPELRHGQDFAHQGIHTLRDLITHVMQAINTQHKNY